MKPILMAAAVVLAAGLLAGALPPSAEAQDANRFFISNIERKRFDARKFAEPIVISFFFVGCQPCVKEIPQLHALMAADYPAAGLLFVDPTGDSSAAQLEKYADGLGVPRRYFYRDPLGRLGTRFMGRQGVFPTIVAIRGGEQRLLVNELDAEAIERLRDVLN